MARKRGLTPKQKRFVEEYLIDLNATQAAVRAGFSSNRASEIGWQQLQKTTVKNAIQAAMDRRSLRTETTADEVLREWRILAFSDMTHYRVDDKGRLILSRRAPFWAKRAVSSFKQKKRVRKRLGTAEHGSEQTEYETEIKLWSKPDALKVLGQHLGIKDPTELPPLEVILGLLPAGLAQQLRPILARALPAGGSEGGDGSG